MFTGRNQCSYSTSVHCFLHHRVGVRSESGSESRSNKDDLGKVSREKNILFSYTVLVSRARVGARAEVTKNDLGKASRKKYFFILSFCIQFSRYRID